MKYHLSINFSHGLKMNFYSFFMHSSLQNFSSLLHLLSLLSCLLYFIFRLTEGSLHKQVGGVYKIVKENGWWVIQQKMRDVVGNVVFNKYIDMVIFLCSGHHKVEMNRVVMEDVFTTMYKFDEVSRNISDFQERCDEYQTDVNNVLLAALPVVINKVHSQNYHL